MVRIPATKTEAETWLHRLAGAVKRKELKLPTGTGRLLRLARSLPLSRQGFRELRRILRKNPIELPSEAHQVLPQGCTLPNISKDVQEQLMPFQKEGIKWLLQMDGRGLLADDMGLGKTCQALCQLQAAQSWPAVVVCPASVKLAWKREALQWTCLEEHDICVVEGRKGEELPAAKLYIINYAILPNKDRKKPFGKKLNGKQQFKKEEIFHSGWVNYLQDIKPMAVVVDECQAVSNVGAKRTKAVARLARAADGFVLLSGTPIRNRPKEFFTPLKMLKPDLFPSRKHYEGRYCGAKSDKWGQISANGCTNADELHSILRDTVMLRRTKEEVLPELPERITSIVPLPITNRKEYRQAVHDFLGWLAKTNPDKVKGAKRAQSLAKIEALKNLVVEGKLKACIQWMEDFLNTGEKLVVFYHHKAVGEALQKHFGKAAVKLDGNTPRKQRQENVDAFQQCRDVRLFLGNYQAAGTGITLTAASCTAMIELPWSPMDLNQAEDRVRRIGQESDSINSYYLLAEGTIENDIAELLDEKRIMLSAVMDGEEVKDKDLLVQLMKKLKRLV